MAAERNITIYKGDTYVHEVRIKNSENVNTDITGRTYKAQIRKSRSSDAIVLNFDIVITDAQNGIIRMSLSPENTSVVSSGTYFYDFEEKNQDIVTTLMSGKVTVTGDVTYG
jgi:hypothetical protein